MDSFSDFLDDSSGINGDAKPASFPVVVLDLWKNNGRTGCLLRISPRSICA